MSDQIKYFNIDWLSEHDGPGQRVVLFLQGCPLDCAWCHSPHSQPPFSPLLYFDSMCIQCGRCTSVCPNNVHSLKNDKHIINRAQCTQCGQCVEACPQSSEYSTGSALLLPTRKATVYELFECIEPQLDLLRNDGGITFSGGEPLLQVEALAELAKLCKQAGYNTALETSAIVPLKSFRIIAPYIDTWLFGARLTTGTTSYPINFLRKCTTEAYRFLMQQPHSKVIVRIPAIPGHTDTISYINGIKQIAHSHPKELIDILPCNQSMSHYYHAMGSKPHISYNEEQANAAYNTLINSFQTQNIIDYAK